jgi:flavin-dependent dehydrogenase
VKADALIVGGGLSGAAAAICIARAGRSVHLLESQEGIHHKACGEFLSIEAQQHLQHIGLDLDVLGASQVRFMRLVTNGGIAEARLPFVARGLSRSRLDEALIDMAAKSGAYIERPVRALDLLPGGIRTNVGERHGRAILLATGKISLRTLPKMVPENAHVGFKMHWRLPGAALARLEELIELTLFPDGYAGLQLVEGGIANLCLVLRRERLTALGGRWEDVLAMIAPLSPGLRAVADGEPLLARPVTIANLPYGRIHASDDAEDIYRVGDQAAMTASLTGDGMAIALRSGWLAAQSILAGQPAPIYHERLRAMVGPQIRRGMVLQRLAEKHWLSGAAVGVLRACPALLRWMVKVTRLPEAKADATLRSHRQL